MNPEITRRHLLQIGALVGATAALAACTPAGVPTPTASETWMPPTDPMTFPANYTWGAATSAFQVEGSTTVDGRGPSIWDTFAAQPGRIRDGSTGDPGADHYRRWESDLDLMAELGLGAYRFSVAWPRIQPTGSGAVNQIGVDFYRKLVDGLVERGIRPGITLYHWDLPQPLQDAGGWPARDTASRFAEYSRIMFDALGDVDADWFTINEPKTTAFVGHLYGSHAPGISDPNAAAAAVHHQLLAHGLAVQQFRDSGARGRIGIALNLTPIYPTSQEFVDSARAIDGFENRLFLDPVLLGTYPDDGIGPQGGMLNADRARFDALVLDGDLAITSAPTDFLAIQYYGASGAGAGGQSVTMFPTSSASWQQIYPQGLYDLLMRLKADYPATPIIITENGTPDTTAAVTIDDANRVTFLRDHFIQASRAIADGVPLEAHYVWSLLDNFEWAEGYTQRWGIVAVDFETQERTPKDSFTFYQGVIASNSVPLT
ncbi:MAG: GH1 family beta-glucosidase [Pseudolysinimonas sp.]